MYGQGNYGPPMGQGPYTSSMFHQRPAAPVLRPFSQSSQTARPITFQHGPQPVPPQVGQVGYPSYQHTPAGSHQSGPALPVPSSGVNTQPYLTTAPPVPPLPPPPPTQPLQVHGSSQMPQHSQWAQNAHIIPPTVPSVALTVLPPPPSQGQTLYGSQAYQPSLSVVQAHPPSHQPASRFFISPPVGAFGHSVLQHSNILAPGPPPPPPPPLPTSPSGAPPLPLSSPPPTSSSIFSNSHMRRPNPTVFDSAFHSQNGSEIDRSVYGSVHEVSASCLVGDDGKHDGSGKCDGESGSKMGSSCVDNLILDLPTPPPKPVDDRTVHKIEVLCQFIAKNGPEFEDMTCQREFGNPEFKFLFGGEPGSQNAVAHEYFIWMKNKCLMAFKSAGKLVTIASPMRLSEDSSYQLNISTNTGVPSSPVDSDMDMEDDITHPEEELQIYPSNNLSHEVVSVSNDLDMKDESRISCSQEHCLGKDALDGNSTCYGSSGLEEQRQDFRTSSDQNQSIMKKSVAKADGLVLNSSRNVEKPSDSNIQGSFSLHEHLSQQNTSTDLEETRLEKLPDQPVKGASPFRLLQDYASEGSSENEAHVEDAAPSTVTASIGGHSRTLDTVAADNSGPDLRPKSLLGSDKDCELLSESCKFQDFPFKSPAVIMEAGMASSTGKLENFVDDIYSNQGSVRDGISHGEHTEKTASTDANVDASVDKKEGIMSMPTTLKVDEFGRLIREGASDSDSGGSPHYTRRRGKRNRSRSRSRSPRDRRRRRSPWRRKERRGRSRSFSPKRCRSRSKSPARGDGEYPGDKMRRDKGQHPECFDFRRGKCYRGSSCRYLHHEDKNHRSRSYRSKQQLQDLLPSSRRSDVYEKNDTAPDKKLSHQHDECRIQGQKPLEHMPGLEERKILGEPAADLIESPVLQNPYADASKLPSKAAYSMPSAVGCLEPEQSRGHYSGKVFQNLDQQHEKTDNSSASETSPVRTSASAPSQLPEQKSPLNKDSIGDAYTGLSSMNKPDNISSHSMVPQESIPTAPEDISHLPPSSFPLLSQETSASHAQQVPNALHSASVGNYPVYQASISYPHSQYALPPNPSWNSLPPPPALPHPPCPLPVNDTAESLTHGQHSGRPVHFQQIILPSENNFLAQSSSGPRITEFPTVSHVGRNQAYPLMQEPSRPSHLSDDLRSRTFPMSQTIGQVHGGPGLVGEDRFTGRTLQALYPSNDNTPKNFYSQALPFPRELASKRGHGFPAENLPPAELSTPSSQSHSHLQQPSYGLRYPAADSISSLPGDDRNVSSTLSRYTSDLLDRNQHSRMSDFGGSRISNHYNPYASTFEQPLSSKFGSNILLQEKERQYGSNFGAAYSFSDVPVGRADASLGSGYMISPQNSVRGAEGILPTLIGDQYDPLYDSIEPSSNSIRKSVQKLEATDESDVMIRFSGSNKPLDVEDNKKQKGGGTIGITASIEDEEYGETADAEVGAVEDGSPSSTNDAEDAAAGEVEIDQVKAPGKSKKNKDSRSMKLFKVALANFVKEVLKPSWRQGNMSKEAFKTIVKKTVDKVSGAMKSHHIPKSQSKINHYIDSSQRKLTKLVMGYVDKYVKV